MYHFLRRRSKVGLLAAMLALAVASTSAFASHIPGTTFPPAPFTVNPSALGFAQGPFQATFIDYSYIAAVDQVATGVGTGAFTEQGAGFFSVFRHPNLFTVVPAPTSGLNVNYQLYAQFSATGTTLVTPGGVEGTFTSFNLDVFVDPNFNTVIVPPTPGGPDENLVVNNTADDLHVLASTSLFAGGFHANAGLAAGDFDAVLTVTPIGAGYFGVPVGTIFDINGNNTSLTGFTFGDFTDGIIIGSGNVSLTNVPEPTTLLLLGTGLAAVGLWRLRRKDA